MKKYSEKKFSAKSLIERSHDIGAQNEGRDHYNNNVSLQYHYIRWLENNFVWQDGGGGGGTTLLLHVRCLWS